jgi:hypothetical protein
MKDFVKKKGFELVETAGDGNCFFDALKKSGKVEGTLDEIRKKLVDHIDTDPELELKLGITKAQLEDFRKSGVYACDVGDFAPEYAHSAFGIRLHIYDMRKDDKQYTVRLIEYGRDPGKPLVSVLRSSHHYRLLVPKEKQESR